MPRPAADVASSIVDGVETHTIHVTGYDPGWTSIPGVNVSHSSWTANPESVNNPIKADGTRDVSAYWIKRYLAVMPDAHISQAANGRWGYHTKESTRAAYCTDLVGPDARWNWQHVVPSDLWMTNCDAIARINFLTKLEKASGKSKVELGVMAGEFRETIGMATDLTRGLVDGIHNTARSVSQSPRLVARSLNSVKSLGMRETARRLLHGDVSLLERMVEGWLVYQFGLVPLSYDVYDSTVYLGAQQQRPDGLDLQITVKSGYDTEPEERVFQAVRNGSNAATYNLDARFLWYGKVHYVGTYKIPTRASIPEELGLYNPMLVADELLKFSWLVDYAITVGGWLRSMMAAQGTHFIVGTKSELRQARFVEWLDGEDDGIVAGLPVASQLKKLQCSIAADFFSRELLGPGGIMPPFLPGVKSIMNEQRLANSLAALTTLVGARSRSGSPII